MAAMACSASVVSGDMGWDPKLGRLEEDMWRLDVDVAVDDGSWRVKLVPRDDVEKPCDGHEANGECACRSFLSDERASTQDFIRDDDESCVCLPR
jgi:hypothetical protein